MRIITVTIVPIIYTMEGSRIPMMVKLLGAKTYHRPHRRLHRRHHRQKMVLAPITVTARQLIIVMADIHAGHVRRITSMAVFLIHMTTQLRHASLTQRPPHLPRRTTKTAGGVFGQPHQIWTKTTVMIPAQLWPRLPGRKSTLLDLLLRRLQIKVSSQLLTCHYRHRRKRMLLASRNSDPLEG